MAPKRSSALSPSSALLLQTILWVAVLWLPVQVLTDAFFRDSDVWFHLRTGQWIAQQGTVPKTDPFSSFGEGKPLVAYSWLYELVLFQLHRAFGVTAGILVFRFALSIGLFAVFFRMISRRVSQPLVSVFLTGALLLSILPSFYERPWLFSILFFSLTWDAIESYEEGNPRALWLLPLWFALWANLHIQFVFGLALLGLATALAGAAWISKRSVEGIPPLKLLIWVSAACFAATFLNPYHYQVYSTVFGYIGEKALVQTSALTELGPLGFRGPEDWALLTLVLAAAFSLGRTLRWFEALGLAFTCYLSFRCTRDRWCVAVVASLIVARALGAIAWRRVALPMERQLLGAGFALVVAFSYWANENDVFGRGLVVDAADYPVRAVDYLEKQDYSGKIFTPISFGAYVMWRLPRMKVSMDARTNVHGVERTLRYKRMMSNGIGWENDPDLQESRLILWPTLAPLSTQLALSPDFKRIYRDASFSVFEHQHRF